LSWLVESRPDGFGRDLVEGYAEYLLGIDGRDADLILIFAFRALALLAGLALLGFFLGFLDFAGSVAIS